MAYIPRLVRDEVRQRAQGLCEYCQTSEVIVVEMVIDHILPETSGGKTILENLCLSCISCNSYKRDFQFGVDPNTGESVGLFNPREEEWREHFTWSVDGSLVIGLTPIGRATVERLRMNREPIVQARRRWVLAGWHPPTGQK